MDAVRFDWDPDKNARNREKHGVTFEEAKTVFEDDLFVSVADPDHSIGEKRYLIMGQSLQDGCSLCPILNDAETSA